VNERAPVKRLIDVSKWQDPKLFDWDRLGENFVGVIMRSTYGCLRDKRVEEFFRLVRRNAFTAGLYHFFRIKRGPGEQLEAFNATAEAVGLGPGDLVPTVDVESIPQGRGPNGELRFLHPDPSWCAPLRVLVDCLVERWGDCMIYLNANDYHRLGAPEWLHLRPLWFAHWTRGKRITLPGWPATLWQHWTKLTPELEGAYPRGVDQNIALGPLPLIPSTRYGEAMTSRILAMAALTAYESARGTYRGR